MITILLLILVILNWIDFYIKYEKYIKKFNKNKKKKWEFLVEKKWIWNKIMEELDKNDFIL